MNADSGPGVGHHAGPNAGASPTTDPGRGAGTSPNADPDPEPDAGPGPERGPSTADSSPTEPEPGPGTRATTGPGGGRTKDDATTGPGVGPIGGRPLPGTLSSLLVLTDRTQSEAAGRRLIDTVAQAVEGGARTILLREKDLSRARRYLLALSLTDLLVPAGAALVVASEVKMALDVGAVAVHLAANDPTPDTTGWPEEMVWGRSCHSAADVVRAAQEGAGYVTLSPIFPTSSKPGYGPALGVEALTAAASIDLARLQPSGAGAPSAPGVPSGTGPPCGTGPTSGTGSPSGATALRPIAVFALGGITPANAAACMEAGASGIAVMGGVMASADPAAAVAAYLQSLA